MSKKTLRKRIALVAVSALGAGLLSVVAVPAANAGNIAASTNAASTAGYFNVAVGENTTGAVSITSAVTQTSKSLGLVYKDASSTTAQTATMTANGSLVFYTTVATTASFVASGGTWGTVKTGAGAGSDSSLFAYSGNQRNLLFTGATSIAAVWTPGAVGTYTVSLYKGDGAGTVPTSTTYAQGTLVGQVTVTVVATTIAGTYSAADSLCNLASSSTTATGTDVSGADVASNGGKIYLNFALKDGYGDNLGSGGSLVATAPNAVVNIGSTIGSSVSSTSVSSAAPQTSVVVAQATANAPVTTTITLTYNGTTVCTKTVTITGEVASMKITSKVAQDLNTSTWTDADYALSGGVFYLDTLDSAGNKVIPTGTSSFASVTASLGSIVTAVSIGTAATGTAATDATGLWPLNSSLGLATCAGTAGTQDGLKLTYQNPSGSIITSPAFSVRCADNPYTYSVSLDKTTYSPGEIATMTVKFLDIKGNPAASLTTGTTATITSPQLTVVTAPANAKKADINGTITHKFTVGTTTGSFQALVDYPTLTGVAATIQTVSYKISDGAVSNTEVLAAIVKLIASINKQISALQKLLTKKK